MMKAKQKTSYAPLVKEIVGKASSIRVGTTPVVVVPLDQWHEIEDILTELGSELLVRDIARARLEHARGKSRSYTSARKSLGLA